MSSKASLIDVIRGSHSVFLLTTPMLGVTGSDTELNQGKNVTDVAKEAGVQHLIFSSLLNVTETSGGRLTNVPHFDQKAQVEQYIRSTGIPATFVLPGSFMSNYTQFRQLQRGEDGVYTLCYPVSNEAKFPLIDIDNDMGKHTKSTNLIPFQKFSQPPNPHVQVNSLLQPSSIVPRPLACRFWLQ